MKKLLIPIDFSTASVKAVQYVEDVFKNQDYEMELIYIKPVSENGKADERIAKDFKDFEHNVLKPTGLAYNFHVLSGSVSDEIQKAIHKYEPAFVIMGTAKAALAKALVKLTDCPILFIPENCNCTSIKKIGYANDFNDIKVTEALKPLLNISRTFGSKVQLIHISKDQELTNDKAEAAIEYYLDGVDHEYVFISSDDFVKTMRDYVARNDIDLLAVLIRDHGDNEIHSKGALVEQLVGTTNIPLLNLI